MKKRYQFLLLSVCLVAFFIFVIWFQTHRLLPSLKTQEMLVQKIQTMSGGTLRYQGFQVRYFPQPQLVLDHPQLVFSNHPFAVEAEKMCFDFKILPLLFGRAYPSAIYVRGGHANAPISFVPSAPLFQLDHFSLEMGTVAPQIPIPIHLVSDLAGHPKALVVKGYVTVDSLEKWDWPKMNGHITVTIKGLSVESAAGKIAYNPQRAFLLKNGQFETTMEITKKSGEAFLDLTVAGNAQGLVYETMQEKTWVAAPALDAEWNAKAAWNNDTEELRLHKILVKLPFGQFDANGSMKLNTGEITGMHIAASEMVLENLLPYLPGLEKALPFHIGFSGPSQWTVSMEGTLDHLSLHVSWAFAKTILTYAHYFSKPKDIPLDLNLDFLVQKGKTLSGDFSVKFQQMTMKGNVTDLDLKTGQGQLNLITNKFSVNEWEQYIPALQRYKIEGDVKVLGNWKGDLRKLEQAEHIFNVTIEKGAWVTSEGKGIRNANITLDYSPLMLEARKMQWDLGDSTFSSDLKITKVSDQSVAEGSLESKTLKPVDAWKSVTALFRSQETAQAKEADFYDHVKNAIADLFPSTSTLENVSVQARYGNQRLEISNLKFGTYDGQADLKGTVSFSGKENSYHGEGEIRNLNLGLFLSRYPESAKPSIEGILRLQGSLDGTGWGRAAWHKNLKGQGEWMLTNGRFDSFDPKDTLALIESFKQVSGIIPTLKNFDSMNFHWRILEGKMTTDDLLIKTPDYVMDGEGTVDFDGLANFRADHFLAIPLAAKLLPTMASSLLKENKAHLGPIPILLSGTLTAPEVKPDPFQVQGLVEKIRKGKTKGLLCELVMD